MKIYNCALYIIGYYVSIAFGFTLLKSLFSSLKTTNYKIQLMVSAVEFGVMLDLWKKFWNNALKETKWEN